MSRGRKKIGVYFKRNCLVLNNSNIQWRIRAHINANFAYVTYISLFRIYINCYYSVLLCKITQGYPHWHFRYRADALILSGRAGAELQNNINNNTEPQRSKNRCHTILMSAENDHLIKWIGTLVKWKEKPSVCLCTVLYDFCVSALVVRYGTLHCVFCVCVCCLNHHNYKSTELWMKGLQWV